MICAVVPTAIDYQETAGTLRWAQRAKLIQNQVQVHASLTDERIACLQVSPCASCSPDSCGKGILSVQQKMAQQEAEYEAEKSVFLKQQEWDRQNILALEAKLERCVLLRMPVWLLTHYVLCVGARSR